MLSASLSPRTHGKHRPGAVDVMAEPAPSALVDLSVPVRRQLLGSSRRTAVAARAAWSSTTSRLPAKQVKRRLSRQVQIVEWNASSSPKMHGTHRLGAVDVKGAPALLVLVAQGAQVSLQWPGSSRLSAAVARPQAFSSKTHRQ